MSLSIAVSCFGAMSVVILSGARVYYAMARDGVFIPSMRETSSALENAGCQSDWSGRVDVSADRERPI